MTKINFSSYSMLFSQNLARSYSFFRTFANPKRRCGQDCKQDNMTHHSRPALSYDCIEHQFKLRITFN